MVNLIPSRPHPVWAAVTTLAAASLQLAYVVLACIAYAHGDYRPSESHPTYVVNIYAVAVLAASVAAWLLTPEPKRKLAAEIFRVTRIIVLAMIVVATAVQVLGLGPDNPGPQVALVVHVIDAFLVAAISVGVPVAINLVGPVRRRSCNTTEA